MRLKLEAINSYWKTWTEEQAQQRRVTYVIVT
jgi:hypothetical protein